MVKPSLCAAEQVACGREGLGSCPGRPLFQPVLPFGAFLVFLEQPLCGGEAQRAGLGRFLGKRYQWGATSSAQWFVWCGFGGGFLVLFLLFFFLTAVVFWLHLTRQ